MNSEDIIDAWMFRSENKREVWDTDHMIRTAKSLQYIVEEVQRKKPPRSDPLLSHGKFVAIPVLLSLATEIALKALQCQGRKAKPDHSHDLLELFNGLEQDVQTRLLEKLPEVPVEMSNSMSGTLPIRAGIKTTLGIHRKKFERWRYLYESPAGIFEVSEINDVLTVLIEVYNEIKRESL